ncbi:MAG: FtsW/RodA/SpoVE family cell cycle protein [Clostridia bacterium]|nr:FtsW/RodA/SpoVE family cell cycle protein [Clostridia bacterium]
MEIERDSKVQDYLDNVCSRIKCRDVHPQIKLEILVHIEDNVKHLTEKGLTESQALEQALKQMGDPVILGRQLHRAHKPRMEWSLLLLVGSLVSFGLFTLYAIEANGLLDHTPSTLIFTRSLIYTLIGLVVLVGITVVDYRRVLPFSGHMFAAALLLLTVTALFGLHTGGKNWLNLGVITIDFVGVAPYFLIIALAGIFTRWSWETAAGLLKAVFLLTLPILLMINNVNMASVALYTVAFVMLMVVSGAGWRDVLLVTALPLVVLLVALFSLPHRLECLTAFLFPSKDPLGSGYLHLQLVEAMRSAGLWGQGFDLPKLFLPGVHSEFVFTYIVYAFGWLAGAVVVLLGCALLVRMAKAAQGTKDQHGRLLITGMAGLLFTQFAWNVLMNVGLAPISGVSLPFISYGGSLFVVNMTALGLILSVYRRKNRELLPEY